MTRKARHDEDSDSYHQTLVNIHWDLLRRWPSPDSVVDKPRPIADVFLDQYRPMLLDVALRLSHPFVVELSVDGMTDTIQGMPMHSDPSRPLLFAGELERVFARALAEPWEPFGLPLALIAESTDKPGTEALNVRFVFDRPWTGITPVEVSTEPPEEDLDLYFFLSSWNLHLTKVVAERDPAFQPVWLEHAITRLRDEAGWNLEAETTSRSRDIDLIPRHIARLDPRAPKTLAEAASRHL